MRYRIVTTNLAAHVHEVEADGEQEAIDRYRMGEAREVHTETETDLESVQAVEEPRLPATVPGTPEAGVQMGSLGVPDKAHTPAGKGVAIQVSMDDQMRLETAP